MFEELCVQLVLCFMVFNIDQVYRTSYASLYLNSAKRMETSIYGAI